MEKRLFWYVWTWPSKYSLVKHKPLQPHLSLFAILLFVLMKVHLMTRIEILTFPGTQSCPETVESPVASPPDPVRPAFIFVFLHFGIRYRSVRLLSLHLDQPLLLIHILTGAFSIWSEYQWANVHVRDGELELWLTSPARCSDRHVWLKSLQWTYLFLIRKHETTAGNCCYSLLHFLQISINKCNNTRPLHVKQLRFGNFTLAVCTVNILIFALTFLPYLRSAGAPRIEIKGWRSSWLLSEMWCSLTAPPSVVHAPWELTTMLSIIFFVFAAAVVSGLKHPSFVMCEIRSCFFFLTCVRHIEDDVDTDFILNVYSVQWDAIIIFILTQRPWCNKRVKHKPLPRPLKICCFYSFFKFKNIF